MQSLVGKPREIEGIKQFLNPRWVVWVTVCLAQFTGIFQRLASVKWSTDCPDFYFKVSAFEFDAISEIETLTLDSST